MDTEICEVVITAGDAETLLNLTRTLVEERLAACGQTIASVRSIYRWEGAVQDDPEARVALHTRTALVPEVVGRVKALHSYGVPCVIALPVVAGNPDYIQWVLAETREPQAAPAGGG
jgi:periplasmic divalent cation tolerance protein